MWSEGQTKSKKLKITFHSFATGLKKKVAFTELSYASTHSALSNLLGAVNSLFKKLIVAQLHTKFLYSYETKPSL